MSAYSSAILALGPIAYWRLGEASGTAAADATGHGYTAFYEGGVGLAAGSLLAVDPTDTAVSFNGTNADAAGGTPASNWNPNTGDVFTLEAWVKPSTVTVQGCIISQDDGGPALYMTSSGQIQGNCDNRANIATATVALTANTVHHVAFTKNGASVHLYLDGVDVTGAVSNYTCGASTTRVASIGSALRSAYGGLNWFAGTIDEAAIYGFALTPAQIAQNYTTGRSAPPITATGTGAVAFAGSGTAQITVNATGNGAIAFAGSGTAKVNLATSGSGAIAFAGSGTAKVTLTAAGSGAVTFAGSGTATLRFSTTGTGALVFAGAGRAFYGNFAVPIEKAVVVLTGRATATVERPARPASMVGLLPRATATATKPGVAKATAVLVPRPVAVVLIDLTAR